MRLFVLELLTAISFLFSSCYKDQGGGAIQVTVKHGTTSLVGVPVYLKRYTLYAPPVPLTSYDQMQLSGGAGQVFFDQLPSGKYLIYVQARENGRTVQGEDSVLIRSRFQDNEYQITIDTSK